jgi:hypothetical protein
MPQNGLIPCYFTLFSFVLQQKQGPWLDFLLQFGYTVLNTFVI